MRSHNVQQETKTKFFNSDQDFIIRKNAKEVEFIRHLTLTTEERNLLAEKINAVVKFDRILDDIRESVTNAENILQITATCVSKKDDVTAAFEKHNSALIHASQGQPVHVAEAVSNSNRLKSLLHTALGYVCYLPDESSPEACKETEALLQFFQKIKLENSEASDTSVQHFPELPNLPPHKKVEHQRFFSKKKKPAPSERRLSKPTEMQKKSIKAVMNATTSEVVCIHNDFDHTYNQTKETKKKKGE